MYPFIYLEKTIWRNQMRGLEECPSLTLSTLCKGSFCAEPVKWILTQSGNLTGENREGEKHAKAVEISHATI